MGRLGRSGGIREHGKILGANAGGNMRIRSRVLAAIVATSLMSVVSPAPSPASAEESSGLTLSRSESGGIIVSVNDASFLSALNKIPQNSREIYAEYSYIDPSGPWSLPHDPESVTVAGQSNPLPAEFQLNASAPPRTTHMRVRLKNGWTGAELSSALTQIYKPHPVLPIAMNAKEWYTKGSYVQFQVRIERDERRWLPGQVCESGCNIELWGVYPSGEKRLIKSSAESEIRGYFSIGEFERVMPALSNLHAARREFGQSYAVPGKNDQVSNGVNLALSAALLAESSLTPEEICLPLNNLRTPSDGSTTEAYLTCTTLGQAGITTSFVRSIAATYGLSVVSALIANALYPSDQAATDPARPVPPPNPVDPPGETPEIVGDPYFVWIDRIQTRLLASDATRTLGEGEARTLARQCYKTAAYLFTSGGRPHPCESRAIFMPGSNILGAAKHKHRAIVQHPEWIQLTRGYRPESKERWYANEAECVGSSPATPCDEYPYRSTQQGGPAVPFGKARASLRIIDRSSNSAEGAFLSSFWARCNVDNGEMFLVVPTVVDAVQPDGEELESNLSAPPTIGFCEVG